MLRYRAYRSIGYKPYTAKRVERVVAMKIINTSCFREKLNRMIVKRRKKSIYSDNIGYLLIAPFYIFLVLFILLPILMNFFLSFTNYDMRSMDFIGLKNYINLFDDEYFLISLKNTFVYTFFRLLLAMVLGLCVALALKDKIFGLKFYRTSFFVPHVTSMVAASMIWLWMFEPSHGIINQALGLFGIKGKLWLFDVRYAMGCIVTVSLWKVIGYNMVIYIAGLQSIPNYLYEAATIDGANALKKFRHITWPLLRPVTFFLFVTGLIECFKVFELVMILTNGGPMNATTTIVHQIYDRAFEDYYIGYGAAQAIVLLMIVAAITIINFKYGNQGHELDVG